MDRSAYDRTISLLQPLFDSGWEYIETDYSSEDYSVVDECSIFLHRSSFVIGVGISSEDVLFFGPAAEDLSFGEDAVYFFDILEDFVDIAPFEGLDVQRVEQIVSKLGLTEPTIVSGVGERVTEVLAIIYGRHVLSGAERSPIQLFDEDRDLERLIRLSGFVAPGVVADPVPRFAAIGLTLCCWRNTALEDLHDSPLLSDAQMAKLSIATTRALLDHIDMEGVDWPAVEAILLDSGRTAGRNGYSVMELVDGDRRWAELRASVASELAMWRRFEKELGAEAVLRLLTVQGATSSTSNWWGNPGWEGLVREVFPNARQHHLEVFPEDPGASEALLKQLVERPDDVPVSIMDAMIDTAELPNLRFGSARVGHTVHIG